jgi:hypothetical protein
MATGNLLLGTGRRSIGDIVLYRRNGKQVSRVRNRKISNPKTDAQYIQRIILQTVSQAYSRMKAITDHSFETVNGAGNNMSRFMRVNLDRIRAKTSSAILAGDGYDTLKAYTPLKAPLAVPDEWIVSQGTMPQLVIEEVTADNCTLMAGLSETREEITYQAVCDKLGLKRGDQLTFVCWRSPEATSGVINALLRARFDYFRIVLDPVNQDGTAAPMTTQFIGQDGYPSLPNPRNSRTWSYELLPVNGTIMLELAGVLSFQAAALIASRKNSDGTYSYSSAQMQVVDGVGSVWNAATLQWALTQSKPQTATENALYLKQATND